MYRLPMLVLFTSLVLGCTPSPELDTDPAEPASGAATENSTAAAAEASTSAAAEKQRSNTLAIYPTSNLADMRETWAPSFAELEQEIRNLDWNDPDETPNLLFSHDPVTTNKESVSVVGSLAATSDDDRLEIEVTLIGDDGVYQRYSSTNASSVDDIVAVFKSYYEKTDDWREQLEWEEH